MLQTVPTGISGAILAGGHSVRFGRDKCAEMLDGKPLIRHAYDAIRPLVSEVFVSTGSKTAIKIDFDARSLADTVLDAGPLSGIATCLQAATHPWLLVVACDLPRVSPRTLIRLLSAAHFPRQVIILRSEEGRTQPLCACYHRSILGDMHLALEEGRNGVHRFLETLQHVHEVPVPDAELININRPGDMPVESSDTVKP